MTTVTKSADRAPDGPVEASPEPPTWCAGSYTIVAPIASGGGGSVWLAHDTGGRAPADPPRVVAVKFLHADAARSPALRRRFLREAEIAASIHHPNVVEVVEVGEASGHPYLVMPFVEGATLRQLLRRGQLPLDVTFAIVSDALRGLTAAHEARGEDGEPLDLVHRDISPHNLLVATDGTTKLTDFGIARPAQKEGVSTTRWAQGKPSYFSPEQGRGEPLDRRSDLFAMGIVLWECLTGRSLFSADDPFVTAHRIQTMRVPPPSTLRRGLAPEIDDVVARALAADRDERYATAAEMLEDLLAAAVA
jgi:serine/threonine-protein kinase